MTPPRRLPKPTDDAARPTSRSRRRTAAVLVLSAVVTGAGLVPGLGGTPQRAEASAVTPPAGWVDHLNAMRADYGSGPVAVQASLSSGAQAHALYMAEHRTLAQDQVPDRARYTAAGRAAAARSLLAGPGTHGEDTPGEFVDLWARGAFSALAMLHPEVTRIGYGQAELGASQYAALDVRSARAGVATTTGWPRTWPSARRPVGVSTYAGSEAPDPVRGCGARPAAGWGLPLLVSYGPGARPTGATATLSVDGAPVSVCVVAADRNPDAAAVARLDEAHSVVVVPREPLRPGRTYTGSVSSSRGAVPLRFSTLGTAAAPAPTPVAPAPVPAASWQRLAGSVRDVTVAPDGTAWALGRTPVAGGYGVLRWTGTSWAPVGGAGVSLDVGRSGLPWLVSSSGSIYRRTASSWQRMPGAARSVAVAPDGTAWVLGRVAVAGGHSIHRWTGTGWATVPGAAVDLDVDATGRAWLVSGAGAVYRRAGTSWQRLPGAARAIGVGGTDKAWVVTRTPVGGGFTVARWTGTAWALVPGGAVSLDVDGTGRPWAVSSAGAVYRRTGAV